MFRIHRRACSFNFTLRVNEHVKKEEWDVCNALMQGCFNFFTVVARRRVTLKSRATFSEEHMVRILIKRGHIRSRNHFGAVTNGKGRHGQASFRTLLRAHLFAQPERVLVCSYGERHGLTQSPHPQRHHEGDPQCNLTKSTCQRFACTGSSPL